MPRELPADATRWLRWAGEDLAVAEHISQDTDLVPRGACVFAHQAADKALKGLLVARGLDPPKLHDLDRLAAPLRLTTSDSTRLTFLNSPDGRSKVAIQMTLMRLVGRTPCER